MNYPIYYKREETLFDNYGECVLDDAYDIKICEKLNNEWTLEFAAPLNEKTQPIIEDCVNNNGGYFKVNNTIFSIKVVDIEKGNDGSEIVSFDCEHAFFDLVDQYLEIIPANFTTGRTMYDCLNYALGNYYMIRITVGGGFTTNNSTSNYYNLNFSVPSNPTNYNFSVNLSGTPFGRTWNRYQIANEIVRQINLDSSNPYRATVEKDFEEGFYLVAKGTGFKNGSLSITQTNIPSGKVYFQPLTLNDTVGSRFRASTVASEKLAMETGDFASIDLIEADKKNTVELIKDIMSQYDVELKISNMPDINGWFDVSLLPMNDNTDYSQPVIGTDIGVQFRYAKNIRSLKKSIDTTDIITKLYVYGNNDISISRAPDNTSELDYIALSGVSKHKVGFIEFNEEDVSDYEIELFDEVEGSPEYNAVMAKIDAVFNRLYAKGLRYFQENSKPRISYEIDIVELKDFVEYGSLESFGIGDFVTVIDENLGTDIKLRVIEYENYPIEPERNSVVLSTIKRRLDTFLAKVAKTNATVAKSTTNISQQVVTSAVAGPIAPESNTINYFNTETETNTISFDENGLKGKRKLNDGDFQTTFHITPLGDATFSGTVEASTIIGSQIIGTSLKTLNEDEDEKGYIEIKYDKPNDESFIQFVDINEEQPSTLISKTYNVYGDKTKNPSVTMKDGSVADSYYENMLNIGFKTFETDSSHIVSQNKDLLIGVNNGKMIHFLDYGDSLDPFSQTTNTNNYNYPNNGAKINFGENPVIYGFPTDGSHNHGITNGRWIMTYDSLGNQLGLEQWVQSGEHNHSANPDTTPPSNITGFAINGFKHVQDNVLLDFSYSGGVDVSSGTSHLKVRGFYVGQPTATNRAYANTINGPEGNLPSPFISKNAIFIRDMEVFGGTVTPYSNLVNFNLTAYDHFNNASNTATLNNFNLNTYISPYVVTATIDTVGGKIPLTNGQLRFKVSTAPNFLEYKNNAVAVRFVNRTIPNKDALTYTFTIGDYIANGSHLGPNSNIDINRFWLSQYNVTLEASTEYEVQWIYKNPRYISPFYPAQSQYIILSQIYTTA